MIFCHLFIFLVSQAAEAAVTITAEAEWVLAACTAVGETRTEGEEGDTTITRNRTIMEEGVEGCETSSNMGRRIATSSRYAGSFEVNVVDIATSTLERSRNGW